MVTVADRLQEALPLLRHFFQGVQLRERGGRKWLYAVVPAKAATNSLSLLVCFPLPDRYPLEPPSGVLPSGQGRGMALDAHPLGQLAARQQRAGRKLPSHIPFRHPTLAFPPFDPPHFRRRRGEEDAPFSEGANLLARDFPQPCPFHLGLGFSASGMVWIWGGTRLLCPTADYLLELCPIKRQL